MRRTDQDSATECISECEAIVPHLLSDAYSLAKMEMT